MRKKIIGKRMPGSLASVYDKAAKMVIDTYYAPIAEEIITKLSQTGSLNLETEKRILDTRIFE